MPSDCCRAKSGYTAGAHFAIRSGQAAAHVIRQRLCLSGNDDSIGNRHQAEDIRIDTVPFQWQKGGST